MTRLALPPGWLGKLLVAGAMSRRLDFARHDFSYVDDMMGDTLVDPSSRYKKINRQDPRDNRHDQL